jgi:hypothetical protein
MRRFIFAAMMIVLLPASGYAQQNKGPATVRTDDEMKSDAAIDKAYQQTMKRTKDQAPSAKIDPWQVVRPVSGDNTKH